MATVKEVITDALEEINHLAAEEPIEPSAGNTAIRYLNDMLTMWDALGVKLGFTKVSTMGDTLTVADGALFGIKKLLAISMAPKFKAEVSATLQTEAAQGWDAILCLTFKIDPVQYPSILPIGQGNCNQHNNINYTFYPPLSEAVYSETGGNIIVESNTEA